VKVGEQRIIVKSHQPRQAPAREAVRGAAHHLLNDSSHQANPQAGASRKMARNLLRPNRMEAAGYDRKAEDNRHIQRVRLEVASWAARNGEETPGSLPSDVRSLRAMAAAGRHQFRETEARAAAATQH
jgi:hypothetical protein